MQNMNERPVCHRAEDLVTYLYGEATAEEARDFSAHLQQCDACRAEFAVFNQVHTSIAAWRNEALGAQPQFSQSVANPVVVAGVWVQHERKLSAWASLREFFSVSPLWLRGATAFAGLLLCALIVFAVSRAWQQPAQLVETKKYSEREFQQAVQKKIAEEMAARTSPQPEQPVRPSAPNKNGQSPTQLVTRRPKRQPANKLTREEREQLAADLGLIPLREEEQPFVLPEEPDLE